MAIPKTYFKENLEDVFIAYAMPYIEQAIRATEDAAPETEALVIQPHHGNHFVSTRDAMHLYRKLRPNLHIPILFTARTRHQNQFFEYGSRLIDLRYPAEAHIVEQHLEDGTWMLWENVELYAHNFLIVQLPIQELTIKPPLNVATNLLSGASQGDPVQALSIPAPKVMGITCRHLLTAL